MPCDAHHTNAGSAALFPAFELRFSQFAAAAGIFIATLLLVGLWNNRGDGQVATRTINRNERQVSGTHVVTFIVQIIFDPDLHPDFHRGVEHAVD